MMTIAFSGGIQLGHLRRRLQPLHGDRHATPACVLVHLRRAGRFVPVGVHHRSVRGPTLTDQTAAGVKALMGGGAARVVWPWWQWHFGAVTSNAMNDYSGSLAAQAGGVRIKRHISAIGRDVRRLLPHPLAAYRKPLGEVPERAAVHRLLDRTVPGRGGHRLARSEERGGPPDAGPHAPVAEPASGWPALLALVVGFGAMVPFMNTGLLVGPAANALDGADISFLVGFVVAAAVYYPMRRLAAQPVDSPRGMPHHDRPITVSPAAPAAATPTAATAPAPQRSLLQQPPPPERRPGEFQAILAMNCSANPSQAASRALWIDVGRVALPGRHGHPRRAQEVGDPGVFETTVEIEVGESPHGHIHRKGLFSPPGPLHRLTDTGHLREAPRRGAPRRC